MMVLRRRGAISQMERLPIPTVTRVSAIPLFLRLLSAITGKRSATVMKRYTAMDLRGAIKVGRWDLLSIISTTSF
jgi:hypothetical protein